MMLSESQERMLLVAERGREARSPRRLPQVGTRRRRDRPRHLRRHAARSASRADRRGNSRRRAGRAGARLPAPDRSAQGCRPRRDTCFKLSPAGADLTANFRRLLAAPAIASKRWIFEQYDHMVRTNTTRRARRRRCGRRSPERHASRSRTRHRWQWPLVLA